MHRYWLILILIFTLITRLWQVNQPAEYIFDEVYHVVTIRAYAENNPAGYEWWHKPPEPNTAYEWLHPPLAKLIQAGSVKILGDNSFAWRFPSVVFGVLSVWATYCLALVLFKKQKLALIAAFLLAADNLHLTMSRITMNDVFVTTFIVFALAFLVKKRWYLTGLFAGLALATKHSSIMLWPIFGLWLLWFKPKDWLKAVYCLSVIPLSIYVLSFSQFFLQGHSLTTWYQLHQQIWGYQTGLTATHGYQSSALSWPLLWRPVWFNVRNLSGFVGNIYNLGNPAIFWGGLVAVILQGRTLLWRKVRPYGKTLVFLLVSYGLLFLPLALSPRILFLHHYLPALPLLCIILAYTLDKLPKLTGKYLLIATILFFFFYPLNTSMLIPTDWVKYWFWLPSWR